MILIKNNNNNNNANWLWRDRRANEGEAAREKKIKQNPFARSRPSEIQLKFRPNKRVETFNYVKQIIMFERCALYVTAPPPPP